MIPDIRAGVTRGIKRFEKITQVEKKGLCCWVEKNYYNLNGYWNVRTLVWWKKWLILGKTAEGWDRRKATQ